MRKILCIVSALALMLALTACGGSPNGSEEAAPTEEKAAVCYVVGNTACSKGLNYESQLVEDNVYSTIRNYGYISVIRVDGAPEVVFEKDYNIEERFKSAAKTRLDMDARKKTEKFQETLHTVVAEQDETDYLKALQLAVRTLSSLKRYDSKTIVVLGTGLSTSGVFSFRNNLISAQPEDLVKMLKEREALPDFSGMTVYWQNMGDVAAPQEELSDAQLNRLKAIWQAIVEAGNGKFELDKSAPQKVDGSADYPNVTPVELPDDVPIVNEDSSKDLLKTTYVLPENQVGFVEDEATYLHPEQVVKILQPIAEYVRDNRVQILICGTIAGDTETPQGLELSKQRALTVKKTLQELQVPENWMTTIGLGCHDPWHITGLAYEEPASVMNRKVVLLRVESDTAKEILRGQSKTKG